MRTPIENCLFFIKQLEAIFLGAADLDQLNNLILNNECLIQVIRYMRLIRVQLVLTQTYVNDMLDLKQIKNGVFSLVDRVFDPNATIQMVVDIFEQQASAKGIQLLAKIASYHNINE